jgi:hypothetical protein
MQENLKLKRRADFYRGALMQVWYAALRAPISELHPAQKRE